jgi:hypothetical protein
VAAARVAVLGMGLGRIALRLVAEEQHELVGFGLRALSHVAEHFPCEVSLVPGAWLLPQLARTDSDQIIV